jgi:hypothetical protein
MDVDQDFYYRISTSAANKSQLSMAGTYPYLRNEEGLVTWGFSDNDAPTQQWQLFPVGPSIFMLRTKASGPNGYLSADKGSNPVPRILDRSETDDSMLWRTDNGEDGTFYLSNLANGAAYHLEFKGANLLSMSKNVTQPQLGQAFSFVKLKKINDPAFSAVQVPSSNRSTTTFTHSSTITKSPPIFSDTIASSRMVPVTSMLSTSMGTLLRIPTPTSSYIPASSTATAQAQRTQYKLSPSASMGLGVAVGVFGLVFITAISLFIYQRWGQRWGRHWGPESLHYRRAKMWNGFTPAEKNVSCPSLGNASPSGQRYLVELPESPAAVFSPMIPDGHMSWNSHVSWLAYSPHSPGWPITPGSPPAEMPV